MITVMRKYFKGRALQVVAWLTIISVVGFWGGAGFVKSSRRGHGPDMAIVTINDQEVSVNDYSRVVNLKEDFVRRVRAQYGQYADLILQMQGMGGDPRRQAYDSLIVDSLLDQAAKKLHVTLQSDYISYKLAEPEMMQQVILSILPANVFDAPGVINADALSRQLRHAGLTQDVFNEMISEVLDRDLASSLASAAAYAPQIVIHDQFVQEYLKKKYSLLTIPFEPFLKKEKATGVSDEELKAFFNRESKRYMVPEKRIAKVWTFSPNGYQVEVSAADIEEYYNHHRAAKYTEKPEQIQVRRILLANEAGAMEKAALLRQELLKEPARFEQKAKELSVDKESAKNGGFMPFFAKGTKDEAFERASFMLPEDGSISEPVVTKEGVELIQRVSRKAAEYKSLKSVESDIRSLLMSRKFQERFAEDVRPVMEQPEGSEQLLMELVQKRGIAPKMVTVDAADQSRMARVIFSLPEKGISCFIDNGNGVAVQLLEVQMRFLPPLHDVKDEVLADLHKERAMHQFEKSMKEWTAQAATKPLAELAQVAAGKISTVDWLDPQDNNRLEELRKKKLPVAQMVHLDKVGAVTLHLDETEGIIIRLDDIAPFDEKEFEAKKNDIAAKMDREESYLTLQGFVASLYRNATIKPNKSLLDLDEELAI